jgi:hypothetical protein
MKAIVDKVPPYLNHVIHPQFDHRVAGRHPDPAGRDVWDRLDGSVAASLNYPTHAVVLSLSRALLPPIAQGNFLVSTFRRLA